MESGWCWRAAEARSLGYPAPEDPRECLAPCPDVSEEAGAVLGLVTMAGGQLRAGGFGAFALDWTVLIRMADDLGIRTDAAFYERLKAVEREYMAAINPPKEPKTGPE